MKKVKRNGKTVYRVDYSKTVDGRVFRRRGECELRRDAVNLEAQFEKEYLEYVNAKHTGSGELIRDRFYLFTSVVYPNVDTRKGYESKYKNYLDGFYKDNDLSFITKRSMEQFRKYVNGLKDKKGNEISLTLKQSIWEKNITFINWLTDREDIPAYKYFAGLKRFCDPHKNNAKTRWELEEFEQFIKCVDDYTEKTYFVGLFTIGTRKSELNNLKYGDINTLTKTWNIEKQYKNKSHGETRLKTQSSIREVPMSDLFLGMVNKLRNELKNKGLTDEEIDSMHVFLNEKGDVFPPETLRRHFKDYLIKAGLKDIRLHDLRGSFASRMMDETGNFELVRQILGHSDIKTTMMYITPGRKSFDKIRELNECININDDEENDVVDGEIKN